MYVHELLLPRSPQVPASSNSLAFIEDAAGQCLLQGRPLQALDYIQQAIDLRRGMDLEVFDSSCLAYIQASVKAVGAVAMGMLETGDLNLSLQVFARLEEVLKGCPLAAVTSERCAVLNNLACVCRKAGQLPVAKRHLSKALRLCEMFKESEMDRAGTHLNMCAVLSNLGRHGAALEYGKKAVQYAQEDVIGRKSLEADEESKHAIKVLAVAYFNVAAEYEHLTAFTTALDWYRKAVTIVENSDIPALKDMMDTLVSACKAMRRKAAEASSHTANSSIARSRPVSAQQNRKSPATRPASASRPSSERKEAKPKRRPSSSKRTVPMPPLSAPRQKPMRTPLSVTPQPGREESVSTTKSGKRLMTCIQWAETEPVASGSDLDSLSKMGVMDFMEEEKPMKLGDLDFTAEEKPRKVEIMDFSEEEKPRRVIRVRGSKRRPAEGRMDRPESAGIRGKASTPLVEPTDDWGNSSNDSKPMIPISTTIIQHDSKTEIEPVASILQASAPKQPENLLRIASGPIAPASLPIPLQETSKPPTSVLPVSPLLLHQSAIKLQAVIKGRAARNKAKMLLVASHRRRQRKMLSRLGKKFNNGEYGVVIAYEMPAKLLFVLGSDSSCECEIDKPKDFSIEKLLNSIDYDGEKFYFPAVRSPIDPATPQLQGQISPSVNERITRVQALFRGNIARRLFSLSQAKLSKEAIRKRVYRAGKQLNGSTFGLLTIYRLGPDLVEIVVEPPSTGREYEMEVPFSGENYEELAGRIKFNGAAVVLGREPSAPKPITPRKPAIEPVQPAKEQKAKVDMQSQEPEDLTIYQSEARVLSRPPVFPVQLDSSSPDQSIVEKAVILLIQGEKTLLGFQYLVSVSFLQNIREFELEAEAISIGAPALHPVHVMEDTIQQEFGLSLSMNLSGIAETLLDTCTAVKFRLVLAV